MTNDGVLKDSSDSKKIALERLIGKSGKKN